jgi:hypothetical protein
VCRSAAFLALLPVVAACSGETQLYPELLEQSAGIAGSASVFDAGREPASGVVIEMISVGSGADQAPETGVTGSALLLRNGELLYWGIGGDDGPARGFSVALLDSDGNLAEPVQSFDVFETAWTDQSEGSRLLGFLDAAPNGALLVFAVADDAGLNEVGTVEGEDPCNPLTDPVSMQLRAALGALGSGQVDTHCFRDSWALAAVVGTGQVLREAHARTEPVAIHFELP